MINLRLLIPDEAKNLGVLHPELIQIWDRKAAQEQCLRHTKDWGNNTSLGEILFIQHNDTIIGLTGWYDLSLCTDTTFPPSHAGLRWHGILPQHRKKNFSRQALKLLAERIQNKDKKKTHLVETYPTDRPDLGQYFLKTGFSLEKHYERPGSLYTDFETVSIALNKLT